jgi:orotidine-5'-phosphate decarboxylase
MTLNSLEMKNTLTKDPRERLIFALDTGSRIEDLLAWVDRLREHVGFFKIGKESFVYHGPDIVRKINAKGCRVFLDLKFHDIPNTVAAAAAAAVNLGVAMFNVHALGGRKMMEETVASAGRVSRQAGVPMPITLAVTVLTSLNDDDLQEIGFNRSAGQLALSLAKMAQDAGMSGVVASAHDVENIRSACGRDFIIVTPGIRAKEAADDDQKRTQTAKNAIASGADYLVVGRPIRIAPDPVLAADGMAEEIAEGLAETEKMF